MNYNAYRYIYPTRPKNAIPQDELDSYDNGTMIAQPKLNGSNCTIFTNGDFIKVMGRHNQVLSNFQLKSSEILDLYKCDKDQWLVINGEFLNKSKLDENGRIFNHKLVIFDILVYNSDYLIGKSFEDRILCLDKLYGKIDSEKEYLYGISDNIYRVKSYENDFNSIFENITKIDIIEGLVLKRKNSRLEVGSSENNNFRGQIKARKATKLYKY